MNFNDYQSKAKETIQTYKANRTANEVIPFLGIIGEAGSVVSELKKKLRDGESYNGYKTKLKEELGDVLWYISAIAYSNNLDLNDIAKSNIAKINDRFIDEATLSIEDFDKEYPKEEKFPDELEIEFIPFKEDKRNLVKIIDRKTGKTLGNPLTDNNYDDDGYRFHDIFHFGYLTHLGWSPVLRKLLNCKRKSNDQVDENEDGARAQIIEELISLLIYDFSTSNNLLKYRDSVDSNLLKLVKKLVKQLEVKVCTAKQWENTILNSFDIFNKLIINNGGRVLVSKKNRLLTYLGKN
jgi:NTP pyrophosphatase (non-canonical NTP hydrolase)